MSNANALAERSKPSMAQSPVPCPLPYFAEVAAGALPRVIASSGAHQFVLVRRQPSPDACKRVLAEEVRVFLSELPEDFDHRVGVPELRQRPIDRAEPLRASGQTTRVV